MAKQVIVVAPDGCQYWCDGHLCDRTANHCDQCMCKCGRRWSRTTAAVRGTCGWSWPTPLFCTADAAADRSGRHQCSLTEDHKVHVCECDERTA